MIRLVRDSIDRWATFLSTAHWLRGAAILRICFGAIVGSTLVLHIRDREFLFGPSGLFPWQTSHQWDLVRHSVDVFGLNGSEWYFNLCFSVAVLVALAFTLGIWTQIMTPVFVVFAWSVFHREPDLMDGGYRLMNILLIYLIAADLGAFYSLDYWLAKRCVRKLRVGPIRAILHNTGVMLCMFQVCTVYLFSTFFKITGVEWQQGTALYYALSNQQFNTGALTDALLAHPLLLTIGNYATLLYQGAFVWLIWDRRWKYVVIGSAVLFHTGIAVLMGLPWFSAIMISSEAIFLSDIDYERIGRFVEQLFRARVDQPTGISQHA